MLLHVEVQLLGLAGEHFGELQQAEEEHQLQVFAGQLLAFLRLARVFLSMRRLRP